MLREFPSLRNILKSIKEESMPDDIKEFSQVEMRLESVFWLGMLCGGNDAELGMSGRKYIGGRQDKQANF